MKIWQGVNLVYLMKIVTRINLISSSLKYFAPKFYWNVFQSPQRVFLSSLEQLNFFGKIWKFGKGLTLYFYEICDQNKSNFFQSKIFCPKFYWNVFQSPQRVFLSSLEQFHFFGKIWKFGKGLTLYSYENCDQNKSNFFQSKIFCPKFYWNVFQSPQRVFLSSLEQLNFFGKIWKFGKGLTLYFYEICDQNKSNFFQSKIFCPKFYWNVFQSPQESLFKQFGAIWFFWKKIWKFGKGLTLYFYEICDQNKSNFFQSKIFCPKFYWNVFQSPQRVFLSSLERFNFFWKNMKFGKGLTLYFYENCDQNKSNFFQSKIFCPKFYWNVFQSPQRVFLRSLEQFNFFEKIWNLARG